MGHQSGYSIGGSGSYVCLIMQFVSGVPGGSIPIKQEGFTSTGALRLLILYLGVTRGSDDAASPCGCIKAMRVYRTAVVL